MVSVTNNSQILLLPLVVQEQTCFRWNSFGIEIQLYLGQSLDVHYFQVIIHLLETNLTETSEAETSGRSGLLRVGTLEGGLSRELQLRESLGDYKLISEIIATTTAEQVKLFPQSKLENVLQQDYSSHSKSSEDSKDNPDSLPIGTEASHEERSESASDGLEEEFLEAQEISSEIPESKILLLSNLPDPETTLETWLEREHSLELSLSVTIQICQLFNYVYQQGWCLLQINPKFIQLQTPIQFFDLTGTYKAEEKLDYGLAGDYCSPELAFGQAVDERMSSYTLGTLLYQSIHQRLPNIEHLADLNIKHLPYIYQILKICLSELGDRFMLAQLLRLLVECRQQYRIPSIHWQIAGRSTLGLSLERLQNEDNYGFKQQHLTETSNTIVLGVLADGMGGMAQGQIASSIAAKTILDPPIPIELKTTEQYAEWLSSLVQKANEAVTQNVSDGGTTLSVVLAVQQELMVAHVGDSRIFLLRQGQICQLSEDHSLVAMLLNNGQISYQESRNHPDRSVLTKSIGSRRYLSDDYVQDLRVFGSSPSLSLEDGDILLLCSDGVWDLVSAEELSEIFTHYHPLPSAVDETISRVLDKGAHDNATLLALECFLKNSY